MLLAGSEDSEQFSVELARARLLFIPGSVHNSGSFYTLMIREIND